MHRAHAINNIIKTQTEKQTFEQFIVDIYSPAAVLGGMTAAKAKENNPIIDGNSTSNSSDYVKVNF